jgi:hypothetical protein
MRNQRLSSAIIISQALVIVGLLYWLVRESDANPFLGEWISQNIPTLSLVLNEVVLFIGMGTVLAIAGVWILLSEGRLELRPGQPAPPKRTPSTPSSVQYELEVRPAPPEVFQESRPFYETIQTRDLLLLVGCSAAAVSLLFITTATLRITDFTADSLAYARQLPPTYWGGLGATLALVATGTLVKTRLRTGVEVFSLLLLAVYVIGLPSFVYENPRVLDSYQHAGNSLGLLNNGGWFDAPIWYMRQFPGAYAFFAQLVSVAGIDPFALMKYYAMGLSWIIALSIYVIVRGHSQNYAAAASALFLGGIWFQLHLSPQSLALVLYMGIIFSLLRSIVDKPRRRLWTIISTAAVPALVVSHPTTPLVLIAGLVVFVVFVPILASQAAKARLLGNLSGAGAFLAGISVWTFAWWLTIASEARGLLENISQRALSLGLSHLAEEVPVLANPSPSYYVTVTLEQAVSLTVWVLGACLLVFFRRFRGRDFLQASLIIAGVSTIPLALFAKTDVLQRSYLFSLIPLTILLGWMMEQKAVFGFRGKSLYPIIRGTFILAIVCFSVLMPITRNGVDPFDYIPSSSLEASKTAAGLQDHSVLFIHPGEYGWRFYAALRGDKQGPRIEQPLLTGLFGGFVKVNSTLDEFDLNFTLADLSTDYIMVSDYYQNLYLLRFGPDAEIYVTAKANFELVVSTRFNLVYSTGSDHIYARKGV